tara:strand:- start:2000 stop:2287 length:288 start_codon:yes stop_codon:yes gene_type:complete
MKKTEEERLAFIGTIVKAIQSGETTIEGNQDLIDQLKAERATEELVVQHGLLDAQKEDVEDESQFLDLGEKVDFDQDENEVDMEAVSPQMRKALS